MKFCKISDLEKDDVIFVEYRQTWFLGQLVFNDNIQILGIKFLMGFESDLGKEFSPITSRNNYSDGLMMLEKNIYYDRCYKLDPKDIKWIFRNEELTTLKVTK